jgi:hypothetical protein
LFDVVHRSGRHGDNGRVVVREWSDRIVERDAHADKDADVPGIC